MESVESLSTRINKCTTHAIACQEALICSIPVTNS